MLITTKSARGLSLLSKIVFIGLFLVFSQAAFTAVTADFNASPRKGDAPLTVTFTDQSQGTITAWGWSFPGGSPPAAVGKGPHIVTYVQPGDYDVTLIVVGPTTHLPVPKDTLTKKNYIQVDEPEPPKDYGDAPDDGTGRYPTLKANNGACHIIDDSIYLGSSVDADEDGQPDDDALGDDNNDDSDDEDGVEIPTLVLGDSAEIKIVTHGSGYLSAWIDFNGDLDWDDLYEHVLDAVPLSGGTNTRTILTPEDADTGFTISRWRYSADPVYESDGMIASGEVEDHIAHIRAFFIGSRRLDSLALVALYNSTDGPNWVNNTNWLTGPLDTWHGIVCTDRVTSINLYSNGLNGPIPPELGNIINLTELLLNANNLTGNIPPELGYLINLKRINFFSNNLDGSIPLELGNLTNLSRLNLSSNNLTGSIPPELGNITGLWELWLDSNNLSGPIPPVLGNLVNLNSLDLQSNNLNGPIPPELGNLVNTPFLLLANNNLTGSIPPELGNLTNLWKLDLGRNDLTGSIPLELGNLTNLLYLQLDRNNLDGPIPPELGNLVNLNVLTLRGNNLNGSIPPELGNLVNLAGLELYENNLDGSIPPELGNLVNLTGLYLRDNDLTGSVPAELGNLTSLTSLYMGNNNLTGSIPSTFVNLTSLLGIMIENNAFTDLPDLSSLNLNLLYLHENQLTFEDIEPYMNQGITDFSYSPQDSVGTEEDFTVLFGASLTLTVSAGGSANHYQWFKDGSPASSAPDSDTYVIDPVITSDAGTYTCEITSDIVTDLILYRRPVHVTVGSSGTGIEDENPQIPLVFSMKQNYPNPFNPKTEICFDLPESEHVVLKIYDILGSEVCTLINKEYAAGRYKIHWDGRDNTGNSMSSNIYIYHMKAGSYHAVKKMLLMR